MLLQFLLKILTIGTDYSNNRAAYIVGWGYTSEDGNSLSNILQEAEVTTMTDDSCRNTEYNPDYIYDQHICAAGSGVDSCTGDAGGPLLVLYGCEIIFVPPVFLR